MLAPVWVLLALALLPAVAGRLGLSPLLAAAAGGCLTAAAVLRARGRRWRTAAFGVGGTLWAWVAVALGASPLLLGLLVVVWLPPAVTWWRSARIRARIAVREYPVQLLPGARWWLERARRRELAGAVAELRADWLPRAPEWWTERRYRRTARRTLTAICNDWRRTAANAEVPGCRIRLAEADRFAYTLHVDLRKGQPHERMLRHHSMLGSALGADVGTLRIEPERRMDRVRIRWVHHNPLEGEAIPWPHSGEPVVTSAGESFTLGPNEIGEPVLVRLADGIHTLVVGLTDAGKSALLHVIIAYAAGMGDVVLWGIDLAGGVEFTPWGPVWDRLATDIQGGERLVAALERVVRVRLVALAEAGVKKWEPRMGPYVVLVIDELAQLPPAQRRRLGKLVQLCRKCGVRVVAATQHPSVEETNSGLRSQLDRIICLRLKSADAIRMTFDAPQPQAAGWDPSRLEVPGSFLIKSPRHPKPVMARAYWLDDDTVAAVAERVAPMRPALDPVSAAAADHVDATPDVLRSGSEVEEARDLGDLDRNVETAATEDDEGPGAKEGRAEQLLSRRLPVLLEALRRAGGPVSARGAAALAGLPHGWTGSRGLPELERRGAIRRTEADEWDLVEPGPEVED